MFIRVSSAPFVVRYFDSAEYGVATKHRLLKIIGLFCKKALLNRRYSAKETYDLKEPTNRSHPIPVIYLYRLFFEPFPKKKYQASEGHMHVNMQYSRENLYTYTSIHVYTYTHIYAHIHMRVYVHKDTHSTHTQILPVCCGKMEGSVALMIGRVGFSSKFESQLTQPLVSVL